MRHTLGSPLFGNTEASTFQTSGVKTVWDFRMEAEKLLSKSYSLCLVWIVCTKDSQPFYVIVIQKDMMDRVSHSEHLSKQPHNVWQADISYK